MRTPPRIVPLLLALLFVDLFDNMGTLIGVTKTFTVDDVDVASLLEHRHREVLGCPALLDRVTVRARARTNRTQAERLWPGSKRRTRG